MKITTSLASGHGNLFDEANFKRGQGASFKAHVAKRVTERLDSIPLTVPEAAQRAQCSQADIRRIRKGEVSGYTVRELVELARCFGLRVTVSVDVPKAPGKRLH